MKESDAGPRVNILDFCEEHYEDILPVIVDKIRRDKRKEVHTRLDFGESSKKNRRMREGSQNSSAWTLPARYCNPSERPKMRDRLRSNDGSVFGQLGHRRQSAFERLIDTYSPSTTKSGPDMANPKDHSHSRGRPHRHDPSPSRDRLRSRDSGIEESYGNTCSSYRTGARHRYHSRDRNRSCSMKKGRKSKPPLSGVSKSDTKVDPFTPRIRNFKSLRKTRMPNNVKTYDETGDPDDHVKIFQAAAQQKKYVKDLVEIHNIKQRDGETIKEFMERFKRLNEHVPKTMEEMVTTTTAFIRGETVAASKKKGHTSWKPQDQPKRHVSERKSDFRGQPREGRRSNRFTPLTRTPKEILAAEAGKFKPPPPMVTPVEKRSRNKFCDFHNDKRSIEGWEEGSPGQRQVHGNLYGTTVA
ncbi:hypothetical protein Tco_0403654 [Tanacetum coccineum]